MSNATDRISVKVRSDQWNAQDFLGGPRVFTIAAVRDGKAEAQFDIDLVEGEGRVWRPPSTVLRLLIAAWGTGSKAAWVGRRVELYRDPSVPFGKERVGGIRVSAASHLEKPFTERLMTSRGRYENFTVQPLADAPAIDITTYTPALEQATNVDALKTAFFAAPANVREDPRFIAAKDKRKDELAQGREADA